MILLVFLFVNKKWITISADDLYVLAKDVAKSSAYDRETVILSLKKEIKNHLIKIK